MKNKTLENKKLDKNGEKCMAKNGGRMKRKPFLPPGQGPSGFFPGGAFLGIRDETEKFRYEFIPPIIAVSYGVKGKLIKKVE